MKAKFVKESLNEFVGEGILIFLIGTWIIKGKFSKENIMDNLEEMKNDFLWFAKSSGHYLSIGTNKFIDLINSFFNRKNRMGESINEEYGQKDLVRMQDIKTKAAGNPSQEIALASTQAGLITKPEKAAARAEAAEQVFGPGSEVARIFGDRAKELGGSYVRAVASKGTLAPVKAAVGKGERLQRGFRTQYILPSERIGHTSAEEGGAFSRGGSPLQKMGLGKFATPPETSNETIRGSAYILPIGRVDLATGKSQYFNVYDTYKGIAEVWMDNKYNKKLIFTASDKPHAKIGNRRLFVHDQTGRPISNDRGYWTLMDYVPVAEMKELVRVYGGSLPGYTYK